MEVFLFSYEWWHLVFFFLAVFAGGTIGTFFGSILYRRFGRKKGELEDFRRSFFNVEQVLRWYFTGRR